MPARNAPQPTSRSPERGCDHSAGHHYCAVSGRNDRMSSESTGKSAPLSTPRGDANRGNNPLQSPWLWGPLLTVGFYLAIPHVPIYGDALTRYFAGHWVVYAEMGLFFVGLSLLTGKAIGLVQERRALDTID